MASAPDPRPCCPEFNSQILKEEKNIDIVEVNQWHTLEESGEMLENVDRTHLVMASGEQVLQKDEDLI